MSWRDIFPLEFLCKHIHISITGKRIFGIWHEFFFYIEFRVVIREINFSSLSIFFCISHRWQLRSFLSSRVSRKLVPSINFSMTAPKNFSFCEIYLIALQYKFHIRLKTYDEIKEDARTEIQHISWFFHLSSKKASKRNEDTDAEKKKKVFIK